MRVPYDPFHRFVLVLVLAGGLEWQFGGLRGIAVRRAGLRASHDERGEEPEGENGEEATPGRSVFLVAARFFSTGPSSPTPQFDRILTHLDIFVLRPACLARSSSRFGAADVAGLIRQTRQVQYVVD